MSLDDLRKVLGASGQGNFGPKVLWKGEHSSGYPAMMEAGCANDAVVVSMSVYDRGSEFPGWKIWKTWELVRQDDMVVAKGFKERPKTVSEWAEELRSGIRAIR